MAPVQEGRSLGGHLRALRSSAGGSLADMAVATRISERYLRALESDVLGRASRAGLRQGIHPSVLRVSRRPRGRSARPLRSGARCSCRRGIAHAAPGRSAKAWVGHPLAISGALLLIFGGGLLALKLGSQPAPARMAEPRAASKRRSRRPRWLRRRRLRYPGPPAAAPPAITPSPCPRDAAARRQGGGADLDPCANR